MQLNKNGFVVYILDAMFYNPILILATCCFLHSQRLEEVFASLNGPEGTQVTKETCRWFNLISDFLFRELRDSAIVRR